MKEKEILIVEKSNFQLLNKGQEARSDGRKYIILEGIFGILNEVNRNNRIYTADQYLPQIERLQPKIATNKLLGELNHPTDRFDVDLHAASHVIEKLSFDSDTNQIRGRIRLLNTPAGEIAQRLVEDGIPLHISSRAAGSVNADGTVVMKQLFTYDLVNEPGFERAELTRVNEKYGYGDLTNVGLYEVNEEILPEKQKNLEKDNIYNKKEEMNYITHEQFNKYTEFTKAKISDLQEKIKKLSPKPAINENANLDTRFDKLEESYTKLVKYVNYLSENLNKSISHGDHVVENVMEMKVYVDYLTKNLDKNISYAKYLGENLDKNISYSDYLANKLSETIGFANYLSEGVNTLTDETENNRLYAEYIAEGADKGLQYAEYVANKVDESIQYSESIGKTLNEAINFSNYQSSMLNKVINHNDHIVESLNGTTNTNTALTENLNESYETSIMNRLDTVINEAKRQKAGVSDDKLHFLKFLDTDRVKMFSSLNENDKVKVLNAFEKTPYFSTPEAVAIFESSLTTNTPVFVSQMKPYHKELWTRLDEGKQSLILEQAKNYVLDTRTKIDKFWDSVDLREEKVDFISINENDKVNNDDPYMAIFEKELSDRMIK